jgi:hypothetical protein
LKGSAFELKFVGKIGDLFMLISLLLKIVMASFVISKRFSGDYKFEFLSRKGKPILLVMPMN